MTRRSYTCDRIVDAVATYFRVPPSKLRRHGRQGYLIEPRHIAMYLCRKHTIMSYPELGAWFDKRHHTTIMYGVAKIARLINAGHWPTTTAVEAIERTLRRR
jgi:chromosomal replication initiator protein